MEWRLSVEAKKRKKKADWDVRVLIGFFLALLRIVKGGGI